MYFSLAIMTFHLQLNGYNLYHEIDEKQNEALEHTHFSIFRAGPWTLETVGLILVSAAAL